MNFFVFTIVFALLGYASAPQVELTRGSRPGCFGNGLCSMQPTEEGMGSNNLAILQIVNNEAVLTIDKSKITDSELLADLQSEEVELNSAFKVLYKPVGQTVAIEYEPDQFIIPVLEHNLYFEMIIPLK